MHVFIEITSGTQPICHLLLGENFRKFPLCVKFPQNLQPYLYGIVHSLNRQLPVMATKKLPTKSLTKIF